MMTPKAIKRLAMAVAGNLAIGSLASAEDKPIVTMLKNRPASMFDIGFASLQRAIDIEFHDGYHSLVTYKSEEGIIQIFIFKGADRRTREDLLKECPIIKKRLREFDNYWPHFVNHDQPTDENVRAEIPKIIRFLYSEIGNGYDASCTGMLFADGFTIEEHVK